MGRALKRTLVLCVLVILTTSCTSGSISSYVAGLAQEGQSLVRMKRLENHVVTEVYVLRDKGRTPARMLQIVVTKAYNGSIVLLLDYDIAAEKLLSLEVLEHQETYNYGGYATEDWFTSRFSQKSVQEDLKVVKIAAREPCDIAVITGATITTDAIVDGVNRGLSVFREYKEGNR